LFLGKEVKGIKVQKQNDIKLRFANSEDLSDLIKLHLLFEREERKIAGKDDFWRSYLNKKVVEEDITKLLKNKENYYFIAEDSFGQVLGFLNAQIENTPPTTKIKKICSMKLLYVLPKYRNKRIASQLMNYMELIIGKRTKHFVVSVSPNNKKAIAIYLHKGFVPIFICLGKKVR